MNKKSKVPVVIGLAVVVILLINFGGPILGGYVIDDTYTFVDINSKVTTQIYIEGFSPVSLSSGQTFDMSDWDVFGLSVQYTITSTTFEFPSNAYFELVCDGVVMSISSGFGLVNPYTKTYRVLFSNLEDISMGTHPVYVRAHGTWSQESNDGDIYRDYYELTGQSYTVYLSASDVSKPAPISLSNLPSDQQVDPYTSVPISWTYEYHGSMDIEVTDNGGSVHTVAVGISLVPTMFTYTYAADVSGDHIIKATFTPTDISGNEQVSDIVMIHINAGGDAPTFPPSIDRIDVSVTQPIVSGEPTNIFVTGWYSDVAQKGTVSTVIDGTMNIRIVVYPAGAFSQMKVVVSDDKEYPLQEQSGWDGDVFSATIDTDVISEGLHTVEFWGRDSENAVWYKVAEFTVPIRTSAAMIDPLLMIGISITLVGIVAVIVFSQTRRRK